MKIHSLRLKPLIVCIAIPLILGGAVGILLREDVMLYRAVEKPPLSPPGIVFPIVWSILYILMGISSYLIYVLPPSKERSDSLLIYAVQLAVNLIWPFLFFRQSAYLLAFFWLLLLIALVITMIVFFYRARPKAAYLQIPYLVWVLYAAYLNFGVWWLNR